MNIFQKSSLKIQENSGNADIAEVVSQISRTPQAAGTPTLAVPPVDQVASSARTLVECVSVSFLRIQQPLTFAKQLTRRSDAWRKGLLPSLHLVDELMRCERCFDANPYRDRYRLDHGSDLFSDLWHQDVHDLLRASVCSTKRSSVPS